MYMGIQLDNFNFASMHGSIATMNNSSMPYMILRPFYQHV